MGDQKDFAKPIVLVIEALSSKRRRRILIELENGSLSYTELRRRTGLSRGEIDYHLSRLVASGLIRRFLREKRFPRYEVNTYYEVSDLGKRLIEGILNAFRPPKSNIQ